MEELLPGLFQIETKLGDNRLCLYLLRGERTLLLDSGTSTIPETVIFPALAAAGLSTHVDLLLISHADADHHGGNASIAAHSPGVLILCHELDRPRIESKESHLQGRYTEVVARDDVSYALETMSWLSDMIGPDIPVRFGLRGGETVNLGAGMGWQVLHTPGHTGGHLSLWNADHGALIIQDAILWRGVPDWQDRVQSPPPYYAVDDYVNSIHRLRSLPAAWLLTAHYAIRREAEIAQFFETSLDYVEQVDTAVWEAVWDARRPLTLNGVIRSVDAHLGPFAMPIQWVGPTLAHLQRHVAYQRLRVGMAAGVRTWEAV
jgi:glyoxylase-like metal-dependent hydrolase (beta-lactamase superfamily II)